MEKPNPENLKKIEEFCKKQNVKMEDIKAKWNSLDIKDQKVALIACGILVDKAEGDQPSPFDIFNVWNKKDFSDIGITDFSKFWTKIIAKKQNYIQTEQDALISVSNELNILRRSNAIWLEGIVLGIDAKRDNILNFINTVLEQYKSDPEFVKSQGYVRVFDSKEKVISEFSKEIAEKLEGRNEINGKIVIPIGKNNVDIGNFKRKDWFSGRYDGNPVIGTAFMSTIDIFAKPFKKDKPYKYFQMTLTGAQCDMDVPKFKYCKFLSNISPSDSGRLNPTGNTSFEEIKQPDDFDIKKTLLGLKDMVIDFENIPKFLESGTDVRNITKILQAKVSQLVITEDRSYTFLDSPKEYTAQELLTMFDSEKPKIPSLLTFIPSSVNIDFAEGSKIIVVGRLSYGWDKNTNKEDKNQFRVWVKGIYTPDEYKVKVKPEQVNVNKEELRDEF